MTTRIFVAAFVFAWLGILALTFGVAITRPWVGHDWLPGSLVIGGLGVFVLLVGIALLIEETNAKLPRRRNRAEERAERIARLERELGIND